MKMIRLTGKDAIGDYQFTMVDDKDYEWLSQYEWRMYLNGKYKDYPVIVTRIQKKRIKMARLLMNFPLGIVDHKDKNPLNNQRKNLRIATFSQNNSNRKASRFSTSSYLGVYYNKRSKSWACSIGFNGKGKDVKYFSNEKEAAKYRDLYSLKYHKEFASLNFPENIEDYKKELDHIDFFKVKKIII